MMDEAFEGVFHRLERVNGGRSGLRQEHCMVADVSPADNHVCSAVRERDQQFGCLRLPNVIRMRDSAQQQCFFDTAVGTDVERHAALEFHSMALSVAQEPKY